ncbi:SigE family RNA polymerase sigma factor [Modestobacter italicus]|nr:SigE family RNA polymerase sigma factor [Modestobacter marinus]
MSARDDEFTAFVVAHERQLLRTAYLLTGDHGHAEDLVQTALVKAHRHWSRVAKAESPLAYVRRVVVTSHISWRRRLMTGEQVIDTIPDRAGADPQQAHAVSDELRAALRLLPPRMRAVLVLRFYEDLTEAETARVLSCSTSTVSTQAARGLAALRTQLRPAAARPQTPLSSRRPT